MLSTNNSRFFIFFSHEKTKQQKITKNTTKPPKKTNPKNTKKLKTKKNQNQQKQTIKNSEKLVSQTKIVVNFLTVIALRCLN